MKTGIIDVGGGFRDIYGCGVLDVCMEQGIHFDCCIGVSAGSANLASYLAGQPGRNARFYKEYGFRKEYASLNNYLRMKNYVDLEYVYGTLSNHDGEDPLDYETLRDDPADFLVVATNALTGQPEYLDKRYFSQDCYDPCKASSALPVVCQPYVINGTPYYDGGVSDPVPLAKAFDEGCDRVVLILTRPLGTVRTDGRDRRLARLLKHSYPQTAKALYARCQRYNSCVAEARQYALDGRVLIIAPDDLCGMSTLSRTPESLDQMYEKGRRDAAAIGPFLRGETAAGAGEETE